IQLFLLNSFVTLAAGVVTYPGSLTNLSFPIIQRTCASPCWTNPVAAAAAFTLNVNPSSFLFGVAKVINFSLLPSKKEK
ncbi:hypothetical protein, partial [Hymenobacter roseosalivarius]|uniref:hypothetical protein n=1 Tax=Hymenobacter roseosalivarius TaxID=89967 RepID=UPI001F43F084